MSRTGDLRAIAGLVAIALVGLVLRGWGLVSQPPLEDEVAAAYSAVGYARDGLWSLIMWEHPPLRNLVIAATSKVAGGFGAWGLRGGSVAAGSLSILLVGLLALDLFRDRAVSWIAAALLAIDPLHIALSRQAVQECMTACLILAGMVAALRGIRRDSLGLSALAGALFGLATASKWHGVFPWFVAAVAWVSAPKWVDGFTGDARIPRRLVTLASAYVLVPLAAYAAVFIPWLSRGHSLTDLVELQLVLARGNLAHRAADYAESFLSRRAAAWFLWPTAWVDFVAFEGKGHLTVAAGNPASWLATVPALFAGIRAWRRERDVGLGFVLAVFLASYLPLVVATRPIFVFSAPAVIPFAFLITAWAAVRLARAGRPARLALAAWSSLAVILSVLQYPMATARTLEFSYLAPIAERLDPHPGAGGPRGEGAGSQGR